MRNLMKKKRIPKFTEFEGGEIVQLVKDPAVDGLVSGAYGIVWGVYLHGDAVSFEGSFLDSSNSFTDHMFDVHEVTEIPYSSLPSQLEPFFREIDEILNGRGSHESNDPVESTNKRSDS